VLSADGGWCDFYHLPLEAARDLSLKGTLSAAALDDRQHLSYPLQTLLNFMVKPSRPGKTTNRKRPEIDPMIQGIPQANEFRKKVEFIRSVVKEWVNNSGRGISDMTPEGRLRYDGNRELVNVKLLGSIPGSQEISYLTFNDRCHNFSLLEGLTSRKNAESDICITTTIYDCC
jgi:hypothetical protein